MGKPSQSNVWLFLPEYIGQIKGNVGKLNISVPTGRENNRDSVSSGERKRKRPNQYCAKPAGVAVSVLWDQLGWTAVQPKSQKLAK